MHRKFIQWPNQLPQIVTDHEFIEEQPNERSRPTQTGGLIR
jgi:hypothetical protein